MKLNALLNAVREEIRATGGGVRGATASLSFVVRGDRDGEVECDFIDAADIGAPREGQIHRLEVDLELEASAEVPLAEVMEPEAPAKKRPVLVEAATASNPDSEPPPSHLPPKRRTGLFSRSGLERPEVDSPSIYRARPGWVPA